MPSRASGDSTSTSLATSPRPSPSSRQGALQAVESLPGWLTPLPDAAAMRAIDRWAIEEQGVPGLDLMARAGAAGARAVERLAPDGDVAILSGTGNNGGDGVVAARLPREARRRVGVRRSAPPSAR